jgi:hypothetical protein
MFAGLSNMRNSLLLRKVLGFSTGLLSKRGDVGSGIVSGSDMARGDVGLVFPTADSLPSRRVGVVGGAVLGEEDWKESREGRVGFVLSGIGSWSIFFLFDAVPLRFWTRGES